MYSRFPLYSISFIDSIYDSVDVDVDAADAVADDADGHYCLSGQEKP